MRKSSKAYIIVSSTHLILTITWVAVLQPSTEAGYIIFETLIGAQLGYWFFSTTIPLILSYHERKGNNTMVLLTWGFILIGTFGFGLMGLKGLIEASIEFSEAIAIRSSIPIFWGYGFAQTGIRELSGEPLNSINLEKKRK